MGWLLVRLPWCLASSMLLLFVLAVAFSTMTQPGLLVRILIVEDDPVMRLGLEYALAKYPQFQIVDQCADGEAAIALASQLQPDLIPMGRNALGCDTGWLSLERRKRVCRCGNGSANAFRRSTRNCQRD